MIERQIINGKEATVAYIKGNFEPATKEDFEFAKIIFEDGEVVIIARNEDEGGEQNG